MYLLMLLSYMDFDQDNYSSSMLCKRFKAFIVAALLLSFVGQSIAAVNASCKMMNTDMSDMDMVSMMDMDHSEQVTEMPATYESNMDCCDGDLCTMATCLWSFSIATSEVPNLSAQLSELYVQYSFALLDQDTLQLFRPPISH